MFLQTAFHGKAGDLKLIIEGGRFPAHFLCVDGSGHQKESKQQFHHGLRVFHVSNVRIMREEREWGGMRDLTGF
jgi:hypothetical protein